MKKRKGCMTLLGKMMTDIPNTIWDPLIKDGKIVIRDIR